MNRRQLVNSILSRWLTYDEPPRTPDDCRYVKRSGLPKQIDGLCEGFQRSETDDEPAELCKECKHNYFNEEEEDKPDDTD